MSNRPIIGVTVGTPINPNKFGGTSDYSNLENKPKINGVELEGDFEIEIPKKTSQLNNDSGFVTDSDLENAFVPLSNIEIDEILNKFK